MTPNLQMLSLAPDNANLEVAPPRMFEIAELVIMISSFLPLQSLKNIRLSNRAFDHAFRDTFFTLFFSSRKHLVTIHSLRGLRSFIENDTCLQYLKSITLSCRQPCRRPSWESFGWTIESDFLFEYEGLDKMISTVFRRLHSSGKGISLCIDDAKEHHLQYGRAHWEERLKKAGMEDEGGETSHASSVLLDVFQRHPRVIHSVTLGHNQPDGRNSGLREFAFCDPILGDFRNLQTLSVTITHLTLWNRDTEAQQHFINFVTSASNIRSLTIAGDYAHYYSLPGDDDFLTWMHSGFASHTLQDIQLRNVQGTIDDFSSLLRPHTGTVKRLGITNCTIPNNECWQDLMVSLKSWPCLMNVRLKLQRSSNGVDQVLQEKPKDLRCELFLFKHGIDEVELQERDGLCISHALSDKLLDFARYGGKFDVSRS